MLKEKPSKDSMIAAAVSFVIALLILLILFCCGLSFDKKLLAQSSIPEIQEEEEIFLEPELLTDLGEPDAVNHDSPAPAMKGEPEPAETDNTKLVVKGDNPKPAPPVEKLVTTPKESPVTATNPSITEEEKKKVTSSVAKGFSGRNGATEGKTGTSGAGGTGTGVSGNANGRTFLGCPKPDVTLQHPVKVTVTVVIDAVGTVTSASASGSADASIRRKCEQAARQAKWTEKKGAGETRGTITFNIYPK